MPITYTVAVDFNDDGDFADLGETLNLDVLALRWRLGLAQPYDPIAAPIEAEVTLRNVGRAYSPELAAALRPGKPLRIQSNDDVQTRTHFTGFIQSIQPGAGDWGEQRTLIRAGGPEAALMQQRIGLPLQVNRRADEMMAAVLDQAHLRWTPLQGYWVLDSVGQAEVGVNTRLAGSAPRSLETGKSTFPYAADTWDEGLPAWEALRQIAASEGGRCFVNRLGELVFHHRHHTLLTSAAVASFSDSMIGLEYAYGAAIVNRVELPLIPRSVGLAGSVIWKLSVPQAIEPGEGGVRRIVTRYRDSADNPIGATEIIAPVAGVDFLANSRDDGAGTNLTEWLTVALVEANASSALLELRNRGSQRLFLLAGAQLRGTPLRQEPPLLLTQTDLTSVNFYGLRSLRLDAPFFNSVDEAHNRVRYELARRKNPRGLASAIRLSRVNHATDVLARTLFDRITVQESQTGHNADYFIIAEEHQVELGGSRHQVRWLLEPAAANTFWLFDSACQLDVTAVLAY